MSLLGSFLPKLLEVGSNVVTFPTVDSVCDTSVIAAADSVELFVSTTLVLEDVFCEIGDGQLVASVFCLEVRTYRGEKSS